PGVHFKAQQAPDAVTSERSIPTPPPGSARTRFGQQAPDAAHGGSQSSTTDTGSGQAPKRRQVAPDATSDGTPSPDAVEKLWDVIKAQRAELRAQREAIANLERRVTDLEKPAQ
ncbi:MAG: hypothetical protein QOD99_623, partial [Chthoniobacter sp.]|nr:hypothetical protein [Chthoniobacter sp.]